MLGVDVTFQLPSKETMILKSSTHVDLLGLVICSVTRSKRIKNKHPLKLHTHTQVVTVQIEVGAEALSGNNEAG